MTRKDNRPGRSPLRVLAILLTTAAAAPAQGAILDFLDGETLYDGGFLLSLGHEIDRRDTLRAGTDRVDDPLNRHELRQRTTLAFQYGLRHDLQLGLAASWIDNEASGIGMPSEASSIGDLELLAKWRFLRLDAPHRATNFALLGGLSLPTGPDDETSGGVELDPDLQPGSGSLDPMIGAAVTHEPGRWRFNAAALYQRRTDLDDDGDRLGHAFVGELAVGNRFWLEPYPGPFMRLDLLGRYYHEGRQRMDGPLADSGGDRVTTALNWAFRPQPALDFQVRVEVPVWEDVNGTQLAHDWALDITFGFRF